MCLGDGGAAQARADAAQAKADQQAAEDKRQADIKSGQASIDSAFSQFNPAYYDNYKQTYTAANTPQVNDQYGLAKDSMAAALAGRGIDNSTIANSEYAQLSKQRDMTLGQIANNATDAATSFQQNVENSKSNLYSLNEASADPQSISARAIGQATALMPPQSYTPLGDLFSSIVSPVKSYVGASMYSPYGMGAPYATGFSFAPTSGNGSGRVTG